MEETGLTVNDIHFLTATNSVFTAEHKHYVTIFMRATVKVGLDGESPEPLVCHLEWVSTKPNSF